MKGKRILISMLALGLMLALAVGLTQAQEPGPRGEVGVKAAPVGATASAPPVQSSVEGLSTSFTYQGRLTDGGGPANDSYDFQFKLYDAASGGGWVGTTPKDDVTVTDGLFMVELDFGSGVFTGDARYLEIGVRPGSSSGTYTTLLPRQALTPAPYALALPGLWTQQNATSPNLIGGYSSNSVTVGVEGATIGGGGASGYINQVTANYATIGGGLSNAASDPYATVGGGGYNSADGWAATVGGGDGSHASGQWATVPGGRYNNAQGDYSFATGRRAKANHDGAFVWADSTDANFASTANNQFAVRANGGVVFSTGGASFRINGGDAWTSANDGSGSGLDADKLDDQDGPYYLDWNNLTNVPAGFADGVDNTGGAGGDLWSLTGNAGTSPATNFLGTTDNQALELRVNNVRALRLEPNADSPNLIGGFSGNSVTGGVVGATIGGGGQSGAPNQVMADYGTIGGGEYNEASGERATIGGGGHNSASDDNAAIGGGWDNAASDYAATIGGGSNNRAYATHATIGGGDSNHAGAENATVGGGEYIRVTGRAATVAGGSWITVTNQYAAVGGGQHNIASGDYATVSGGGYNTASGFGAVIAGGGGFNSFWSSVNGNTASGESSTIGGGINNTASGAWATIGGGQANTVSNQSATVGGGSGNVASEAYATVGGGNGNIASGEDSTVGGGDVNEASGEESTIAGGRANEASGVDATIAGGELNVASGNHASIGGGFWNTASGHRATIGGGFSNQATAAYATIAGGGRSDPNDPATGNRATDIYATIGGGGENQAGNDDAEEWNAMYATVGGGLQNTASGAFATIAGGTSISATHAYATVGGGIANVASQPNATVGGGNGNTASGDSATVSGGAQNEATVDHATVSGGRFNTATDDYATVGGGGFNEASGEYATVPGGRLNTAQGAHSFAAGRRAKANHDGAFVWADATDVDFESTDTNQFRVRATNGADFLSDNTASGFLVENNGDGDGIRAFANVSRGASWAAVYAVNNGTSPAVYANTNGTYSGYFMDDVYVEGSCVGCVIVYIGLNDGSDPLEAGDLVAVSGVSSPLAGATTLVMRVRRAGAGSASGVVGVVQGKADVVESSKDGQLLESANRAEGAAAPGDYVFIVVQGIAHVKADATAGAIVAGQRLTAADRPGHARALRTRMLEGMVVTEGAPVIGIALAPLDKDSGTIPVLVTLH